MTSVPTFLALPTSLPDGSRPCAAIFGAPHGSPYPGEDNSGHDVAADAIRAASQDDAPLVAHWDFDLGGPLFDSGPLSCIDMGNLSTKAGDGVGNRTLIEARTREILASSAVPIMLGGDDSVVIPFLAGFAGQGPIWILQIDAHIDWRDEVRGERFGYSSPMRRASEMDHVAGIVQVGIRSVGSARQAEVEAALSYGSRLVSAREVHRDGIGSALRHIPEGARVVITLDCDGLDPGIMPGVWARTPGGLSYTQAIDLIAGVGKRATIAGFDLVELYPPNDLGNLSAQTAARLVVNAIGAVVRQG